MQNIEPDISPLKSKVVHVCVAVIERIDPVSNDKKILIAKRPEHVHQGGLWEFPGGKVETGESVLEALDRELFEELDIHINRLSPVKCNAAQNKKLIQIKHHYADKTVFLDVWTIQDFSREPLGKEGQAVRWVDSNDLRNYSFPAANKAILNACLLPNRYFITPQYASIEEAQNNLHAALQYDAELIYFRQPQLDQKSYLQWVSALLTKMPALAKKFVYQFSEVLEDYPGAGVHLSQKRLIGLKAKPVSEKHWFSVSCHDQHEIEQAIGLGADFVTLSPILQTTTHPDQIGMGWDEFKQTVLSAALPVYGLGGLSLSDEDELNQSGAQGLAGISFWQD